MANSRLFNTRGIVIGRRDQGEADRVLRLCTPEGKIEVIAKGARKVRSRKAGHIELFAHSAFVVARVKGSWDIVSKAETVEAHAALRDDLVRGSYARYFIELLDRFFTQGEGEAALFDLLNHALTWLCEDDDLDLIARVYEQHLLGLAGFRPELFRCVEVHDGVKVVRPAQHEDDGGASAVGFDPERGGVVCRACYEQRAIRERVMPLSPRVLRFLRACQTKPYTRLRGRAIPPQLHAQAERVMLHYITHHLEQGLRSVAFLRSLRPR